MQLLEVAVTFLHEHAIHRAHTSDTVRTYMEILYDWFDTLEQSGIVWNEADAIDLIAYRNRMLQNPSEHTGRPYSCGARQNQSGAAWQIETGRVMRLCA
jgi:site-specific recombinase XerD